VRDLFLLRDDVVFLNHGSFGACPRAVFEEYQRWQLELERQPVEFLARRFRGLMREAREALAGYVGAGADELVFVPNATTAVNIVAHSLPLGAGDEVVVTDHEYGAVDRTWRFVCAQRGATLVRAAIPVPVETAAEIVEHVWSAVTPRTRAICLSHITSPTALIFPVRDIVRRAREAGLISIVDGAHAPGQIPLDLRALGADFYASNCNKWLCAPKGSGFLYARRERQSQLRPLVVSWGAESAETVTPSPFINEFEYQGTRDPASFLAVPAAIAFQRAHDWDAVRESTHALAARARASVTAITGLSPLSPSDPAWFVQMVSVPLPVDDPPGIQRRLREEFGIEVVVTRWHDYALLRVSVQAYNTADDITRLVAALEAVLR
jgi:isopenicillin-N epimerase